MGIVRFNEAPKTDTKIPIRRPIAINIPCKTKLMLRLFVLIMNSEIKPPITVRVHSKFAKADTCNTLENLFNGVPLSDRKSKRSVAENTAAMMGKLTKKSVMVWGVMTKLINATLVIKLNIDIKKENFSEEGFMFVKSHLLWRLETLSDSKLLINSQKN